MKKIDMHELESEVIGAFLALCQATGKQATLAQGFVVPSYWYLEMSGGLARIYEASLEGPRRYPFGDAELRYAEFIARCEFARHAIENMTVPTPD